MLLPGLLQIQIMRGLASSNATALTQGFNRMWQDVTVGNATDGELHRCQPLRC